MPLEEQVAVLRHEVAELRHHLARMPGAALAAAQARPPRGLGDSRADVHAEADRTEQLRIATRESAFQSEASNPQWSLSTAQSVRSTLAEASPTLRDQMQSVDCRSRSCRVVVSPASADAEPIDLPIILSSLAGSLPNVTAGQVDQGDGRMATVLYLSR